MFTENKYTRWYFAIIANAKARQLTEYYEIHHVIPRCLGGDDSPSNLVQLTGREHFICHLLLTKMHASHKLQYALICMTLKNPHQKLRYVPNSRSYEKIKSMNAELARLKFTGKQKHNVGKKSAYDPITLKQKLFRPDQIPDGWILGSSPLTKKNQSGKNVGKTYYYHPESEKVIAISSDELPPYGYIKGNPNAQKASNLAPRNYFYDPITGHFTKSHECPDGYVSGSPMKWVTDGTSDRQINIISDSIPQGWKLGRLNRKKI